jgi:hypothetical protein
LSSPQINEIPGGYQFAWNGNEKVQIKVSKIHSRDDSLRAELLITTTAEGYAPHLHLSQFNFMAARSRKDLAKQLNELYPIDWEEVLEQLVVYTTDLVRRGEPVVEICADNETITPPKFLLEPFIIENYPTVFFGDPGSFKSTTAIIITAAVSLPWLNNPLGLKPSEDCMRVLMLDWETDRATVAWQMSCFQRGMGFGPIPFSYRKCALPLMGDLEAIQNAIGETKAQMLIIDSLGLACGGELNEAGPAIAFFSGLRQLKVPALILAHNAKNREGNKSIYGSVYFEAQARSIWQLKKRQEAGEKELDLILRNTKSPPFRNKFKDIAFHVEFTDDSMKVKKQDPKNVAEFLATMGTQDRILEALKNGPVEVRDLSEELDLEENNIRVTISNLVKKNLIVKVGKAYGLLINEKY